MNLEIENLTKVYKNGTKAIDTINLNIGTGMFGLLGPNGAGKSTLMRTIATLQSPDSGSVRFKGIDVSKDQVSLRKVLGYLPQEFGVYPGVSANRLLQYFAIIKGVKSRKDRAILIDKVLEITNLTAVRQQSVSSYSGGMKQRFGIAQMLLNHPELIIVDEPTAGLDPAERQRFLNVLRDIGVEHTVILSTHIVDDVKELCTDMAIIHQGRVIQQSSPLSATRSLDQKIWSKSVDRKNIEQIEIDYEILSSSYNQDNTITIRMHAEDQPGKDFTPMAPQLDDVYFLALQNSQQD